jgi:Tol biopolymer transport system component
MSADGRYIVFVSTASNLVPQDLGGHPQVFLRDMLNGKTSLVSVAANGSVADQGVDTASSLSISADGRFIAFSSRATNLVLEAVDGSIPHLFVWDNNLHTISLVDSDATGAPFAAPAAAGFPSLSADGRFITFIAYNQVFIRDMTTEQTQIMSVASDGTPSDGMSTNAAISQGGTTIAFSSTSTNLVANDTNGVSDVFVN